MSGLANNCSITTLYVLYATTLWKDPHSSYTPTNRTIPIGFMSGLAFISPLCIHTSPLYFGGHDYRPHGSLATAATRSSVLLSYTLRPNNRHYSPSKSFSPSSQYITLGKKNLTAVLLANELSYEAAASTNTHHTPCFRCFLQVVRLTSIRE